MSKIKSVTHSKIGKNKAIGLAYTDTGKIIIDERLKGKKHLEILIHECLHCLNPAWEENKIISHSKELCNVLWKQKYRRVDLR